LNVGTNGRFVANGMNGRRRISRVAWIDAAVPPVPLPACITFANRDGVVATFVTAWLAGVDGRSWRHEPSYSSAAASAAPAMFAGLIASSPRTCLHHLPHTPLHAHLSPSQHRAHILDGSFCDGMVDVWRACGAARRCELCQRVSLVYAYSATAARACLTLAAASARADFPTWLGYMRRLVLLSPASRERAAVANIRETLRSSRQTGHVAAYVAHSCRMPRLARVCSYSRSPNPDVG
jgi:hypothetical protein